MNLQSTRLELVEISTTDIADIHAMNLFEEVAAYNTIGIPTNISQTEALLQKTIQDQREAKRSHYSWAIRLSGSTTFLGQIGMKVSVEKYQRSEIYYSLHPKQWGQGYGTEAAQAVLKFGFQDLGLHRIEAGVHVENTKSISLLERIGMQQEGRCRKILPIRGAWADNYMYAILEEDYFKT